MKIIISQIFILVSLQVSGQHLWQVPRPLMSKEALNEIIGATSPDPLGKELRILWVYGYDAHHIAGAHDYDKIKDLMMSLLTKVEKVTVEEVFEFPTEEQLDNANLVVMYLEQPTWQKNQFEIFKNFIKKGGGVVSLHIASAMLPASEGKLLSECLGFAWNDGTSKWGAIFDDITINNQHDIFRGFPSKITINDEVYWDLFQEEAVHILGSVRTGSTEDSEGPIPKEKLSKEKSPLFWTYELGSGKVFGSTIGHHTFTYFDPEFRIILLRAMAWAASVKPDPFMPLVFDGITDKNNMVGTTDLMRNWIGKKRAR